MFFNSFLHFLQSRELPKTLKRSESKAQLLMLSCCIGSLWMSMQCCVKSDAHKTLPFFFLLSHQRLCEENWAKPKEAVSAPCRKVWHKRRRALLSAVRPPRGTCFSNSCTQIESGLSRQALCCFWFQDSSLVLLLTVLCRHSKVNKKDLGGSELDLN